MSPAGTPTYPARRAPRLIPIAVSSLVAVWLLGAACSACGASALRAPILPKADPAAGTAPADTIRGDEEGRIWTKEGLKEVLTAQSGIDPEGEPIGGKNARLAMLYALLFPGLGQMYNERPLKAVIAMGVETFYLSQILINHRNAIRAERRRDRYPVGSSEWNRQEWWIGEYKERRLDWIWWSSGILVVLLLDAYIDAHLYDMRVGVEGVSVEGGAGVRFVLAF
jgi:hypothetical protein